VSLLAAVQNLDYPVYKVDVTLSTGQSFSYFMVFNSGLPGNADDLAVMACARTIRNADWSAAPGMPAGTTATAVTVTRAVEQTGSRSL
jgi:hypothetical protein